MTSLDATEGRAPPRSPLANLEARNLFIFWTGRNAMSPNRQESVRTLRANTECNVVLITPENLGEWILPGHPIHPAYEHLSFTHRTDYIRCYFMHHHGGGYSDIKPTRRSWKPYYERLVADENLWMIGYQEIGPHGVVLLPGREDLVDSWEKLVGICAFICKPRTPLTTRWYAALHATMDEYAERLAQHPASDPRDTPQLSRYPLSWSKLLGNIFQPLCLEYTDRIAKDLPRPKWKDYL